MRKIYVVLALSGILLLSACYTVRTAGNSGKVPPGQAKKAAGAKSAKEFAPGQQKKHY
jgi:uncharacterized protein YceK